MEYSSGNRIPRSQTGDNTIGADKYFYLSIKDLGNRIQFNQTLNKHTNGNNKTFSITATSLTIFTYHDLLLIIYFPN